jgi:hypothetical protein
MLETSLAALALEDRRIHPVVREQILVIAMLGSLGVGDTAALPALEAEFGGVDRTAGYLAQIRAYLLAWADGGAPACLQEAANEPGVTPPAPAASVAGG